MSENQNSNLNISLDYSNKQLSEFPKELFNFKTTLVSLDISANPLLDLDKTIKALNEFTSLQKLKINIETGDEAKKIIDSLPNLIILNDLPIHEEEDKNENDKNNEENLDENNENSNINDNLIKQEIAQLNFCSNNNINNKKNNENNNNNNNDKNINNSISNIINNNNINTITNNNSDIHMMSNNITLSKNNSNNNYSINNLNNDKENKKRIIEENKFEFILNKIKEYSEITKEKYDLIINEYNKLMNNNIKNTLDICSFFNKVLINLIKDAQEKSDVKISSLKPLLEAQSQNENIRINFEEKIHLALQNSNINNNNNHSNISFESLRDKNKIIKTEANSLSQEKNIIKLNSNNNIRNNTSNIFYKSDSNYKKNFNKSNNSSNKIINKNEIRKQYSNNIKNISLSKIKKRENNESDKFDKIDKKASTSKNVTFSIEEYLSENNINLSKIHNKNMINNINKINPIEKEKEKKKYKFTQKSHGKKKISNKISFQQENIDTFSNTYTNINTDYNNKLNNSQPTAIIVNNVNSSLNPLTQKTDNPSSNKNNIEHKYSYIKKINNNFNYNYNSNDISKNLIKTISTISNDNNYLTRYDLLKNCQDNPTLNSLLLQIDKNTNFEISNIFDGLKDQVNYDYNNIYTINLKNLLDIINQVYKLRSNRVKKQLLGSATKGTLETDLMAYLKSKYGLKKLIIEWNTNILSSIKAYSKINGEVCLFALILRNELDEGSIDILFKIKETIDSILKPLYRYDNDIINSIKNNKEFMNENEWLIITEILYNNDNNLRQRFQNKIYNFIKKLINNDKILEKYGKKILFGDFLNQLIMFNLRLRKKYLNNLVTFFKRQDKNRYGVLNYDEFKLMIENIGILEKDNLKEIIDYLIENADKEGSGQITFNDIVICFDNFYLDCQNENGGEEKIKLLDKINNLNLN